MESQNLPSLDHPWYVIQRVYYDKYDTQFIEYYTAAQDHDFHMFSTNKLEAMIFDNLKNATRTAEIEKAEIRVLVSKEDASEFGHEYEENTKRGTR